MIWHQPQKIKNQPNPTMRRCARSLSTVNLKSTPLLSRHQELKGKLVPFAGYSLPVQYEGKGVKTEHLHCRSNASVFDVSHMGQIRIKGKDRVAFMERLICSDVQGLSAGQAALTLLTNEKGGVIDDAIVANAGDYLVSASNWQTG